MAVHAICPSLRCRKILTMDDEVRGTVVTCRYCSMQFRVPRIRQSATPGSSSSSSSAASAIPVRDKFRS
jgi:hypothetical protein